MDDASRHVTFPPDASSATGEEGESDPEEEQPDDEHKEEEDPDDVESDD